MKKIWMLGENGYIREIGVAGERPAIAMVMTRRNDWLENGRLIQAAPDLLEAARKAVGVFEGCGADVPLYIVNLRTAIKFAEGK